MVKKRESKQRPKAVESPGTDQISDIRSGYELNAARYESDAKDQHALARFFGIIAAGSSVALTIGVEHDNLPLQIIGTGLSFAYPWFSALRRGRRYDTLASNYRQRAHEIAIRQTEMFVQQAEVATHVAQILPEALTKIIESGEVPGLPGEAGAATFYEDTPISETRLPTTEK